MRFGTYWHQPEVGQAHRWDVLIPFPDKLNIDMMLEHGAAELVIPWNCFYVRDSGPQLITASECRDRGWLLADDIADAGAGGELTALADPGADGYAELWAERAITHAQKQPGVVKAIFVDSLTPTLAWSMPDAHIPERYRISPYWMVAVKRFIRTVARECHKAGLQLWGNTTRDYWQTELDAVMWEHWLADRSSIYDTAQTRLQMDSLRSCPKPVIVTCDVPDVRLLVAVRYLIGCFAVVQRPGDTFVLYDSLRQQWSEQFAEFDLLGEPVGRGYVHDGLWLRQYQHGTVIVNANDVPVLGVPPWTGMVGR